MGVALGRKVSSNFTLLFALLRALFAAAGKLAGRAKKQHTLSGPGLRGQAPPVLNSDSLTVPLHTEIVGVKMSLTAASQQLEK